MYYAPNGANCNQHRNIDTFCFSKKIYSDKPKVQKLKKFINNEDEKAITRMCQNDIRQKSKSTKQLRGDL